MTAAAFFINFNLAKIEAAARLCGISGPTWKQDVLADLLHDGWLSVEKAHDLRDPSKRVWYCVGRRVAVACVPDVQALDTLFCIGLVPKSQARPASARGAANFSVPGPWGIYTFGRRPSPPITIEEHLLKCGEVDATPPQPPPAPARKSPAGSGRDSGKPSFAALLGAFRLQPRVAPEAGGRKMSSSAQGDALSVESIPEPLIAADFGETKAVVQIPPTPTPEADEDTSNALGSVEGEESAPPVAIPEELNAGPGGVSEAPNGTVPLDAGAEKIGPAAGERFEATAVVEAAIRSMGAEDASGDDEDGSTPLTAPVSDVAPFNWDTASPQSFRECEAWQALAAATIVRSVPGLEGILQAPEPLDARRQRIMRLEAEIARLQNDLEAVPEESRVVEADELLRRISNLGPRVGPRPPSEVFVHGPMALESLLAALADEAVRSLPEWAIGFDVDDDQDRLSTLAKPEVQVRLFTSLGWVRDRFAGAPPDRLRSAPVPDGDLPLEELLESAWKTEEALSEAAGVLPAVCLALLRSVPSGSVRQTVGWLSRWLGALDPDAFEDLIKTASADAGQLLGSMNPSLLDLISSEDREFLREMRTFEKARRFLDRVQRAPVPASLPPPSKSRESAANILDFGHVLTDDRGNIVAANIVVPTTEAGATFVLLAFPVRIVADGPVTGDLSITVTSAALTAVGRDVVLPREVRIQSVQGTGTGASTKFELQWRLAPDAVRWRVIEPGRYSREEVLPFPVTLGEAAKLRDRKTPRLSLGLSAGDASAMLHFETFLKKMPELAGGTGVGTSSASELVRGRPLGAQVQHEKLEGIVAEGRLSFMVVAPRRFGKTTLYRHLAEHGRATGHEVVHISLERDLSPDHAVQKVWEGLRRALEDRFQASPALGDKLPKTVMDEGAWSAVRRFIKEKSATSLVVLIDEAQAIVPRYGGQRWGNQFKNFIEQVLFEPSEKMAVVQLGLFGTVDLSVRIGQNCRDFLLMHGTEQYAFDEGSLARFLRTVGQGAIFSSKAARVELASWTNNLRTLNSVFDRVRGRVIRLQRAFMLDTDVVHSIDEILSLDDHMSEEIWTYARAELSHRDEWEPVDSFPLAVAWARPELASMPPPQRLEDCVRWLSHELLASGAVGFIPAERVESSLRDLKARGVLRDDGEFYRPLLRELLQRRPHVLRNDRDSQMTLLRLAVDDVEWPEQAEARGEGGEARVFIQPRGDRNFAYRACKLEGDDNRRRFARTCAAIRTLRDRRTKLPGDDHLPRVVEAGFRRDDPSQGIIVYEWIEGESFEMLWPQLPEQGRAHVARQVAMAVGALHARDVIHCDIAPRNVIIDGRLHATLIDFGLARRADQATHTRLAKDLFKAPEQCDDPPLADKASDVYALAMLLRGPEANGVLKSRGLRELVVRMTSKKIEKRPSIGDVVRSLDEMIDFEPVVHQLQKRVEDVVNDAPEWLWEDLMQSTAVATLVLGNYLPWDVQRAMDASFLLHNLFVRIVSGQRGRASSLLASYSGGEELSLASVRTKIRSGNDALLREWQCPEVKAVGLMRIALAHPKDRAARIVEATRELRSREATFVSDMRKAVDKVASMLDVLAGIEVGGVIAAFARFFTRVE